MPRKPEATEYPPEATRPSEIELLLGALSTVLVEANALYVSTPITTGELHDRPRGRADGEPVIPEADKVLSNRLAIEPLVKELRDRLKQPVINPAALPDVPHWTQADYRCFWATTIERFAEIVVFANGWQHSNGCAYEFLTAVRKGIETLDQELKPLTKPHGTELIDMAIIEKKNRGLNSGFLEQVYMDLMKE